MAYIVSYALLIAAVFCSYKLAKEKVQNHIVWPILTALFRSRSIYSSIFSNNILWKRN
mgnify:CR=1 FL=1